MSEWETISAPTQNDGWETYTPASKLKAYIESLPPDRRKAAEAYQQGKGMQESMRQALADPVKIPFSPFGETMNPNARNYVVQVANDLLSQPRGIKELTGQGSGLGNATGKEIDTLRSVLNKEAPGMSAAGNLTGEVAKLYAINKAAPGLTAWGAANPYKFNTAYGTLSGALDPGSITDRAKNAATQGLTGLFSTALGQALFKSGELIYDAGNKIWRIGANAFSETAPTKTAGRVAAEAAQQGMPVKTPADARKAVARIQQVAQALKTAPAGETAGQAAVPTGNAEFTALESIARKQLPTDFNAVDVAQEAARKTALQNVTPDLEQAIAQRSNVTSPLYEQANKSVIPITGKLKELISRMPKETMSHAADLAKIEGKPFSTVDVDGNPVLTGEAMHYIKRSLSDIANSKTPIAGAGQDYQRSVGNLLDEFSNIYGGSDKVGAAANPLYGEARRRYAELSSPVEQSKVLTAMQAELAKPGGGERVVPFLNVLGKGEDLLLKRSTGYSKYGGLEDVLSPQQMGTVKDIAGQLERDTQQKVLTSAGSQKASKIANNLEMQGVSLPGMLWRPSMIINYLSKKMEGIGGEKANQELARLFLPENKGELADLISKMAPNEKSIAIAEAAKNGVKFGSGQLAIILGKQNANP